MTVFNSIMKRRDALRQTTAFNVEVTLMNIL